MTDLPELPKPTKRKLGLQWSILLDTHGLTGEHLRWRDRQGARRRRIEAQMSPGRVSPGGGDSWPDEEAVGRKGIAPSVAVAEGRFANLSEEYWRLWSGTGYETFASWLDALERTVANEVASIWKGHSDPIDQWYETECRRAVEKALGVLVREWAKRARRAELERLKHDEWLEPATAVNGKSQKLGAHENARSANETAQPIDADERTWLKYRSWFKANLERLEAMAARSDPLHLPLDEQDAQRFARNAAKQRFDDLAEVDYRHWVDSGLSHETFSARLSELHTQVLKASTELWSLGSKNVREWYEKNCQLPAEGELGAKVGRWEQRARTAELVRHLSRDGGLSLIGQIEELAKLITEEDQKVPGSEDRRRLRVHLYDVGHRFDGGYTGDFLERSRLAIASVGFQFGPPSEFSPLEFSLRMLFRELVCEREPLYDPQIARLNSEQVGRYLWAPHSGNSTTPDSGEVRNPCEALRWYCQRLVGLLGLPEVTKVNKANPLLPSRGRDARGRARKRDITLLQRSDGGLYESVDFPTAETYADISPRRRQQLMKDDGPLRVVGKGQKRRITVESLVSYCPPAEDAK